MKMKRSYCNPLDLGYRYQHMMENGKRIAYREAADPTLIYFKGVYYLFASMSGGFWHSSDLTDWKYHTNRDLLIYDYAPDVRQVGSTCTSAPRAAARTAPSCAQRTLSDTFEQVSAPFDFWDTTSSVTMTAVSICTGAAATPTPSMESRCTRTPCCPSGSAAS